MMIVRLTRRSSGAVRWQAKTVLPTAQISLRPIDPISRNKSELTETNARLLMIHFEKLSRPEFAGLTQNCRWLSGTQDRATPLMVRGLNSLEKAGTPASCR